MAKCSLGGRRVARVIEKRRYVSRVTVAVKRCARRNIRHLSRIFMSLNNPKAARVFTRQIKITRSVQRSDGDFLFARCRRNLFCPASTLTFVFIYHRVLSAPRCNNDPAVKIAVPKTKFANGRVKHP